MLAFFARACPELAEGMGCYALNAKRVGSPRKSIAVSQETLQKKEENAENHCAAFALAAGPRNRASAFSASFDSGPWGRIFK